MLSLRAKYRDWCLIWVRAVGIYNQRRGHASIPEERLGTTASSDYCVFRAIDGGPGDVHCAIPAYGTFMATRSMAYWPCMFHSGAHGKMPRSGTCRRSSFGAQWRAPHNQEGPGAGNSRPQESSRGMPHRENNSEQKHPTVAWIVQWAAKVTVKYEIRSKGEGDARGHHRTPTPARSPGIGQHADFTLAKDEGRSDTRPRLDERLLCRSYRWCGADQGA